MADKEERILIARSIDYTLTDTDKGELFEGKIAPHCANVFTRQEAIERMAKAIYAENVVRCNSDDCPPGSETCDGCPIWENCKHLAKIALNSLLEDKK